MYKEKMIGEQQQPCTRAEKYYVIWSSEDFQMRFVCRLPSCWMNRVPLSVICRWIYTGLTVWRHHELRWFSETVHIVVAFPSFSCWMVSIPPSVICPQIYLVICPLAVLGGFGAGYSLNTQIRGHGQRGGWVRGGGEFRKVKLQTTKIYGA